MDGGRSGRRTVDPLRAAGGLVASHIAKNSCIYLDAGTTTLALARAILDRNDLQVVTTD
ncbi:hypothetical protein GTI02_26395, partial [Klebsiella pneumoniae]|nr:hypothetical protein [Klebsiella pneumoniae]